MSKRWRLPLLLTLSASALSGCIATAKGPLALVPTAELALIRMQDAPSGQAPISVAAMLDQARRADAGSSGSGEHGTAALPEPEAAVKAAASDILSLPVPRPCAPLEAGQIAAIGRLLARDARSGVTVVSRDGRDSAALCARHRAAMVIGVLRAGGRTVDLQREATWPADRIELRLRAPRS